MTAMKGQYVTGAYNLDQVWCFDITGSMSPYLNTVKENAKRLSEMVRERMEDAGKTVDTLRVRIIGFRDYKYDGKESMVQSPFFTLPQDNDKFQEFLDSLVATGGGDAPENALEALACAMGSEWDVESEQKRHVVVLFTDTSALELHDPSRTKNPAYPTDMPADLAELTACWYSTNQTRYTMPDNRSGRMLLFAPKVEPWTSLGGWANTWHVATDPGAGLVECDMDSTMDIIVNSTCV